MAQAVMVWLFLREAMADTACSCGRGDGIYTKEKSEAEFKRIICKKNPCVYISSKTTLLGNINTDDYVLVSGSVEGNIWCSRAIMINGTVTGNVAAETVYIPYGKVGGDIEGKKIFCSNTSAQITGTITGDISPYTRIQKRDV